MAPTLTASRDTTFETISSPLPLRPSAIAEKAPLTTATEEVDGNTPPDVRKQRATFAADPRPHRKSGTSSSSYAPSSYTRKRAKLSNAATPSAMGLAAMMDAVGETGTTGSRPPSRSESQRIQNAANTGTWNSRNSGFPLRSQSRTSHPSQTRNVPSIRAPSRRGSISQASIPISALISPHAPSISHQHASPFHMRDPRKPPKIQPTTWKLAFPQASSGWYEGGGSPPHAWLFFFGFIIFPLWWAAAVLNIPRTRRIEGGHDGQKLVVLDDPQVEHDAKSWRFRCRIMSVVSLFTYIPFIILVAIFAPRR
ncbi:hypothetical protein BT96DRAFT_960302 [Gymnopus androsaceus JB14]|uniref:Uncharacterized protein n=1 Tax=Gymnopus androsaceus JB14 TaxID=1447944 RepID=A0A6A4GQ48_9AGAR|nr:hypothetical protein BT96DRAFT_960302 [Gymnopus androsaceus JB14]